MLRILTCCVLLLGCNQAAPPPTPKSAPSPQAQKPSAAPQTPAAKIELSDTKVSVISDRAAEFETRYRFVEGEPTPGTFYVFTVDLDKGGIALKEFDGRDLQKEGTVKHQFVLLRQDASSFKADVKSGPSKTRAIKPTSNTVEGPLQVNLKK